MRSANTVNSAHGNNSWAFPIWATWPYAVELPSAILAEVKSLIFWVHRMPISDKTVCATAKQSYQYHNKNYGSTNSHTRHPTQIRPKTIYRLEYYFFSRFILLP